MVYSALGDDRPVVCDECQAADYPGANGPSAKQITWNQVSGKWMCCDCQYRWSKDFFTVE